MYKLINKSGETISKKYANSISEAITLFSIMKKLDKESLLRIYNVVYSN